MFQLMRRSGAAAALLALAASAVAVAGCGGSDEPSAAGEGGVTIKSAEFTWPTAAVTNAILREIVERRPELGVAELETTQLDPAPAFAGASRGDIDVLPDVAIPNQQSLVDKSERDVELLHKTYGDAEQGWYVPSYAVQPGGEAAGLKSVTQLNDYKDAFGGKLIDADPGWASTPMNAKRLEGYGIDFEQVNAAETAQLAQLKRAYEREEPIVLFLYRPHWVFTQYDMTRLEEPTPFSEECFKSGDGACALPSYTGWVAARKDLADKAPEFAAFLRQFEIPLEDMEAMLAELNEGRTPPVVAEAWVEKNAARIDSWAGSAA